MELQRGIAQLIMIMVPVRFMTWIGQARIVIVVMITEQVPFKIIM